MKIKKLLCGVLLGVTLSVLPACLGGTGTTDYSGNFIVAHAEDGLEDDIQSSTKDNGVSDFLKDYQSMTSDQLQTASQKVSPLTNIIGYVMGGVITLTTSGIFLLTALDLAYISIPFVRGLLYSGGSTAQAGGMGMGMSGGMAQQQSKPRQLVSDEAVQCVSLASGGGASMPGMGMGMGMSMGMGSMQQQPQQGTKSTIMAYLKKRTFFLVLFAICSVMLTSSIFIGTGINLAQWGMKIMEMVNNSIPR